MPKRLTKVDRMTQEEKDAINQSFWNAPDEAVFPPEDVAVVFNISLSWLQAKRCKGDGIPFYKPEGTRKVLYAKKDLLAYFNKG